MNENTTMVNDPKYRRNIASKLMAVEFHNSGNKTLQQELKELKELESQGKLRIYYPEEGL